jgi:hypothetical protein
MYCEALFKLNEHRGYKLSIFKAYIMIIVVEPCVEINKIEKKNPSINMLKDMLCLSIRVGMKFFFIIFLHAIL